MEEVPISSETVAVTIMDDEEGELHEDWKKRAVLEVLSDIDRINKRPDKHSSDRQQVGRGDNSGFYKVPEDMRRRAGSEEGALYDPIHVNLWKIRELFEKAEAGDVRARNQVRHYDYHLRSYVEPKGRENDIGGLMWDLCKEFESRGPDEGVSTPSSRDHLLGSPVLWATIFLRDLLNRSDWGELSATDDPECAVLWVSELWADLLLIENQIPFVLTSYSVPLVFGYFEDFIPLRLDNWRPSTNYYHILHLIHDLLLPMTSHSKQGSHLLAWLCHPEEARSTKTPVEGRLLEELPPPSRMKAWFCRTKELAPLTMKRIPTATRLRQAGIKFKPVDYEGFVVEFKRGVLKLPHLHITKCTKKVLMNLIAWELCHHEAKKYFINYAIFMDHLIDTSKDVEILIQSGVFEHSLARDEEVAVLFNGLSQDLVYTKNKPENQEYDIFPQLSFDINKYCKSRRNLWWANLMQDYFESPWSIISLIAGLFLILLTLTQAFFSAYSYFRPPVPK